MRKLIIQAEAKLMFPIAYAKIPENWLTGSNLTFYLDKNGQLWIDSDDGLQFQWTIYGRWMRIT